MILIQLLGGLGNQMFQYAAAKALAKHTKSKLLIDVHMLQQTASTNNSITFRALELGLFKNIQECTATENITVSFLSPSKKNKLLKKLGLPFKKVYEETAFTYEDSFFLQRSPVLLKGYFQSEKYFAPISKTLRQSFTFPALQPDDTNLRELQHIQSSCAISVHIRRGDYVNDIAINAVHGCCDIAYYTKAFAYMQQQLGTVAFVFFSDDPAWVNETFLRQLPDSILIKNNDGADSWKDMYLMSKCRHHIIANSSFSWWGAWLNDNLDKKVIAPKIWFADEKRNKATTDLIPANWIRL